jgi:hypothetical protein
VSGIWGRASSKVRTGIHFTWTSIGVSGTTPRGGGDVTVSALVRKHMFTYLAGVTALYEIPRL